MINQGLVMLVQTGIATDFPSCPGGFAKQLPENQAPPAYAYRVVSDPANLTLRSFKGCGNRKYDFFCYGRTAVEAQLLADAVDAVLNGYRGTLPDPDATKIDSIFRTDLDEPDYSAEARNFFVRLEYTVWYYG